MSGINAAVHKAELNVRLRAKNVSHRTAIDALLLLRNYPDPAFYINAGSTQVLHFTFVGKRFAVPGSRRNSPR